MLASRSAALTRAGDPPLRLLAVDPWCDRRADSLKAPERPTEAIQLFGMRNDWLVAAAAVEAQQPTDVAVQLEGPPELLRAADLKVVGEIRGKQQAGQDTWWLDPLFRGPLDLPGLEKHIRNWPAIRDFPRLHLRPGEPVMLWLTVNTHSLPPGQYAGRLAVLDPAGGRAEIPLDVRVEPIELPVDNPIIGFAWQTFGQDRELAQIALDYGINACGYYDNWDLCRELGFRYFKFSFPLGEPRGGSLDVGDDAVKENLKPIQETVARLALKPEEWGIEIYDEPSDSNAWAYAAWMVRIRRLWPEARFWANPSTAAQNNNYSTVKGIVEPLKPYVTTWCPYIDPLPSLLPALRQAGQPAWYYVIEYNHSRPSRGGRSIPWLAWRYDLQGWAFYLLGSFKDAGEAAWEANPSARMYPGNTVSLWLEGLRQGVQDYKRLWRLQQNGVSRDELTKLIIGRIPKGEDSPWGGADPPLYADLRRELDRRLIEKSRSASPTTRDSAATQPAARNIGSGLQLFVDDYLIEEMTGARLKLHNPMPREVVFPFDAPWEGADSGYATILKDGDRFRMYYRGGGDLSREYTCMAESGDGIQWTRPTLGLFEFDGKKDNNIVWTGEEKAYWESHNFSPFRDANPAAVEAQRYKAVTLGRWGAGDARKTVLLAFVSPDGVHWKRLRDEPIIMEGGFDSHNVAFWDTVQRTYVCYFRQGREGKRSIRRSTSPDFVNWTPAEWLDFGPTPLEHLYTNGIVPYFRAPHIYLGFPHRFVPERTTVGAESRKIDGVSDAVFMSSHDGLHWNRPFLEAFIRPGPDPANWGGAHGNSAPAWGIAQTGENEISVYWAEHYGNYPEDRASIPRLRRGTLRLDGFVSVNAPYADGEMVTRPVVFEGKTLTINYATSAVGSVKVELLAPDRKPIPGFELDKAVELYGDETARAVAWQGGSDVATLAGRPVRIRFVMKDADVYSMRFGP